MVSHLLPTASERLPCAEFTRSIGVRPAGTGLRLDRVVVVSVPLPWPKPALAHPVLKPAVAAVAQNPVAGRLFAAEPWTGPTQDATVEVYERHGLGWTSWSSTVEGPGAVSACVAELPDEVGRLDGAAPVTKPVVMICTQGSHDRCCGVEGVRFADQLDRARPELAIRRISHTGGHRFAPTLLALPSGRMWAWADLGLVDRIVAGAETEQDLTAHDRGWLGAATGAAQVAEHAARVTLGGVGVGEPKLTPPIDATNPWRVDLGTRSVHAMVTVEREIPTIACEAPGGQPVKVASEYGWSIQDLLP